MLDNIKLNEIIKNYILFDYYINIIKLIVSINFITITTKTILIVLIKVKKGLMTFCITNVFVYMTNLAQKLYK